MFQEEYEKYLQEHGSFSHLDPVHDLLMEAMQEVRVGIHQLKELAMMKSEIDEKSKTRKKNYISCASFFYFYALYGM